MRSESIDLERSLFRLLSKAARKGEAVDAAAARSRLPADAGAIDIAALASAMEERIRGEYADAPSLSALLGSPSESDLAAAGGYDWVTVGIYTFGLPATKTRSGSVESAAHRRLKEWAASHSQELGAPEDAVAVTERWFPSGDEADVCFFSEAEALAVEVRPSGAEAHELRRAVFACVKYRAVLEAEFDLRGVVGQVRALLLTEEEPPSEIRELAGRLSVELAVGGGANRGVGDRPGAGETAG